jgi:hypothetical protein
MCSYDAKKSLESMADESFERILQKYKIAYGEVKQDYDIVNGKKILFDFFAFLKKTLAQLNKFKETIQGIVVRKEKEIENYQSLLTLFNDYERTTLIEYSDKSHDKLIFVNPENNIGIKLLKIVIFF